MKKFQIIAGLLSIVIVPVAMAESTGKSYVALDLGSASYSGVTVPAGTYPNPGLASFAFGHHFSERVAAEVGITRFGDSTLIGSGSLSGSSATTTASSLYAAAVGSIPLNSAFDLFGKLGITYNKNSLEGSGTAAGLSNSANHTGLMYGVGAQFHLNQDWDLHAQYENFGEFGNFGNTGSPMKASAITIGAAYNF